MADQYDLMAWRIEVLEQTVTKLTGELKQVEDRNEARDRERAAMERKQLVWGITFLGGIIMTLAGVIWSYRGVIFKGGV